MEKPKLPKIITDKLAARKRLSMDEYLEYVTFHWEHTVDRENIRREKRLAAVNEPFSF